MDEKIEKIKIEIKDPDPINFSYNGQEVLVSSQISLSNKMTLLKNYIDVYFRDGEIADNYLEARYGLILGITDLCTNIEIESLNLDNYAGGLWKEIYSRIASYNEFMSDIYNITKAISDNNAMTKSMGNVFDKFAVEFMNFIKDMDLSADGIKKLVSELQTEKKDFNDKFVSPPELETTKEEDILSPSITDG